MNGTLTVHARELQVNTILLARRDKVNVDHSCATQVSVSVCESSSFFTIYLKYTRKMVPITGRASSLLEIFCMYDKRFEISVLF